MCLMGDEKSREEMTAVGGRSCGREAGCRETVGWSHAISGGLRAAANLTEGCVMWREKGSAEGLEEPRVPAGLANAPGGYPWCF